jgi:signal transduction histidine kinase
VRLKIHYQIVIPFIAVSFAAILATAFVSYSLLSSSLEARLRDQAERAARMIAESDFLLNRPVLERFKAVLNAEIVGYARDGAVVGSTLTPAQRPLLDAVLATPSANTDLGGGFALEHVTVEGRPYRVGYHALRAPAGGTVALVVDASDVAAATAAIGRTLLLVTAATLLLSALVSQLVVQRVSRRLLELTGFTRRFGEGERAEFPAGGDGDEIGQLGAAFGDMARQLRASEERLLRSEKLAVTGMLAARVAHDVRNPLSSIKMQAQLLRPRLDGTAASQESLQAILRDIDQVEWVVKGLLELARPGELKTRPANVNEVLDEVLRQVTAQFRHRKIAIESRLGEVPALPLDVDRFKQALLNLLINGADAMPSGGRLLVETCAGPAAVRLDICDEGPGIDPGIRPRLFDPFMSTKREGVGLGLVNTKSIVERHGGTIELLPREPRGTCARITLPRHG